MDSKYSGSNHQVERVLEKSLCRIVTVDQMQFGLITDRGTRDTVFIMRRMQEQNHAKRKVVYVFCGLRENF